jgi:hypothetical protein
VSDYLKTVLGDFAGRTDGNDELGYDLDIEYRYEIICYGEQNVN